MYWERKKHLYRMNDGVEMIHSYGKSFLNTPTFFARFKPQRSDQEFICSKKHEDTVPIQSNKRIGYINLETGDVVLTDSIPSGAYMVHLSKAKLRDKLSPVELEEFKRQLG